MTDAEKFFKKHAMEAGSARKLARAESEARQRGWTYLWEEDADFDPSDWEGPPPDEVFCVVLRDAAGRVLASLSGVADPSRENYGRAVEAELALEVLGNER